MPGLECSAAMAAPRGVAARPPRGTSEDTDKIAADASLEFGQPAQTVIVVNVGGRTSRAISVLIDELALSTGHTNTSLDY